MIAWVTTLLFICAALVNAQTASMEARVVTTGMAIAGQTQRSPHESYTISLTGLPVIPRTAAGTNGITYTCDPGIPVAVCNTLNTTIAGLYASIFSNVSASIYIAFSNTGAGDVGQSRFVFDDVPYTTFRSALQSHLSSANDTTAFNSSVPSTNPINSAASVYVTLANMRALGLTPFGGITSAGVGCTGGTAGCYDGLITMSSTIQTAGNFYFRSGSIGLSQYDFFTTVEHETDEIIGTSSCAYSSFCGSSHIAPADLYRYQSNGARSFAAGNNSSCNTPSTGNACFSLDGLHMLQHYYNINDGYDPGDWVPSCSPELVQGTICSGIGNVDLSSAAEILVLDVIGYSLNGSAPVPISASNQVTSSSGGTVSGVCIPPPLVSTFTTQSPQVWLFFDYSGANVGDSAKIEFIRPDSVVQASTVTPIATPSGCLSKSLNINGTSATSFPGTWSVRVTWNQSATPLFVLNFILSPANCSYVLGDGGEAFGAAGGNGAIAVTASLGCPWSVIGGPSWIIAGNGSGTGNGTFSFQVLPNAGAARVANLAIGGVAFAIEQAAFAIPGLVFVGSMPHMAAEENWTTTFTLVNNSASSATARLSLFGDPSGVLTLPLTFPQNAAAAPILAASLDRTIAANASLVIMTAGPQTPPVQVGSAQLSATGAVDGFAIFHLIPGAQEAVVPMETRNARSYLLAFDNTGGVVLGVAVENVSSQPASIPVVIRDDNGTVIGTPGATLFLAGNGHYSFVLSTQFPVTGGKRGTIEFDTPAGGRISVLGIRTTPLGTTTTLTTIPALANIGTSGGSIAHIATGNGWQTTFVLVNTGTSAAQANLSFFADNGTSQSLPLSFPQSGGGATTTLPVVNQVIAAGASLIVESAAPLSDPAPTVGSAQLITNGHIGGFVIFRYNPNGQEAVVPLESRNAAAYMLAFDNTGQIATGVAINSVSAQAVNIPVIVRDATGAQIATDTISLAANGHLAFTLGSDKYPATVNLRGTIEFDAPAGAQIGALGIRIPVTHTFTTLPALAK
jgi:hypothetical protein